MAINREEFIHKIKPGLMANKTYKKFFCRFKIDEKTYYKTFDFTDKNWDKRTCINKAEQEMFLFKEKKLNPKSEINENIKLNQFIEQHFDKLPQTTWTQTKKKHYEKYIAKSIGNKKIIDIRQMHIKECIKKQENLELAPRTIKTTLEILNPTFNEAIANRVIDFNPCYGITIKIPRTKKIVLNASEELTTIIQTVYRVFNNNPYYLSLYLFAIQGRRKSEILKLKWEHINFKNNTYLLIDTKNGEHQVFHLAQNIRIELEKFYNHTGWIYESFINPGQRINNIEKQTNKIKQHIPNFTLHRLRNIIVSAMAEQGMSPTLMSAALGHNNTTTLSKYLTLNYMKSSEAVEQVINSIIIKS